MSIHSKFSRVWSSLLPAWLLVLSSTGATAQEPPAPSMSAVRLTEQTRWSVRIPEEARMAFHGALSLDGGMSAGAMNMMYPAPNAAGLLAAIITHGFLAESVKNEQKRKQQEDADRVLAPYQALIDASTHKKTIEKALSSVSLSGQKSILAADDKPQGDWWIEVLPVYSMTQDQSGLILDNATVIHVSSAPETIAYQNTIRVVGRARGETDLSAAWTENQGQLWHETTATMLAQAIAMAIQDWQGAFSGADAAQRTVRYMEGRSEKMERAQLLAENCEISVIKTLRGWMMAVPTREANRQKLGCTPAAATH